MANVNLDMEDCCAAARRRSSCAPVGKVPISNIHPPTTAATGTSPLTFCVFPNSD